MIFLFDDRPGEERRHERDTFMQTMRVWKKE